MMAYIEGELRCTPRGTQYRAVGNVVVAKECTKCLRMKPVENFQRRARLVGGVAGQCKECTAEYMREYYRDNPEKFISGTRRYDDELIEFTNDKRAEMISVVQKAVQRSSRNPLYNAGYVEGISEALDILGIKVWGVNVDYRD